MTGATTCSAAGSGGRWPSEEDPGEVLENRREERRGGERRGGEGEERRGEGFLEKDFSRRLRTITKNINVQLGKSSGIRGVTTTFNFGRSPP